MAVTQSAPRRRAHWKLWLRIAVSGVLLVVLVSKIHPENVLPRQRHFSTLGFFAAALLTAAFGIALSAWRWQRVLVAFDKHVPLRVLVSHYFAGQFVGNVLPSTIGGDVLRVSRGSKTLDSSEIAFASVALERLSGFIALPLLTCLGFLAQPSLIERPWAWVALAIAGVTVVALAVILYVAGHPRLAGRFAEHENVMRFVGAVHVGIDHLRQEPRAAAGVLIAALAYQVSVVFTVFLAVHTLGMSLPVAAVVAFVPAVAMAQVLPLSLNGLGVREGLLVVFLAPLAGVSHGQAVGLGLLWYVIMLIVSLLGAPAFAVGHRHRASLHSEEHVSPREPSTPAP